MQKKLTGTRLVAVMYCLLVCGLPAGWAQKQQVTAHADLVFHKATQLLQQLHYSPQKLDDAFSARVYSYYLQQLDPGKRFFQQKDIRSFDHNRYLLDDEMRGEPVVFYKEVNEVFKERLNDAETIVSTILAGPFDFTRKEVYNTDTAGMRYCVTETAMHKRWRQYLKYATLVQYEARRQLREHDTTMAGESDSMLEAKAREAVLRIEKRNLENLVKATADEEAFNTYMNSIIALYDPHSAYFLPVDRRSFREQMSGIYYGIGAVLKEDQGKVSISELMIGGPAWKSGEVNQGDVIIRVAQGEDKAVDVTGWAMSEVIRLTRGQKGTMVTITFRKQDGHIQAVTFKRDALQLEDTFVKSAIIGDSVKLGYIYFPKFYTDFGEEEGRSCAEDMARELERLKRERVAGIIVDIRNNGGGSLGEVINMMGLFVGDGPVVQVKSSIGEPFIGETRSSDRRYDGPLVVMVNELSASAAEIFAAAIQDYRRGILIGSASTYGKGSVQRSFGMGGNPFFDNIDADLGTLHVTLQKYYRITGEATQLKGVVPDVVLPGIYEPYDMQERDNVAALPWDTIAAVPFIPYGGSAVAYNTAISLAKQRIRLDTSLTALNRHLQGLRGERKQFSLLPDQYYRDLVNRQEKINLIKREWTNTRTLVVKNPPEVEEQLQQRENFRIETNKAWLKNLQKDLYLSEAVYVLQDYIQEEHS